MAVVVKPSRNFKTAVIRYSQITQQVVHNPLEVQDAHDSYDFLVDYSYYRIGIMAITQLAANGCCRCHHHFHPHVKPILVCTVSTLWWIRPDQCAHDTRDFSGEWFIWLARLAGHALWLVRPDCWISSRTALANGVAYTVNRKFIVRCP
jgi:hypothetical protein